MSKALIVLAECVDIRNGKRFQPGEALTSTTYAALLSNAFDRLFTDRLAWTGLRLQAESGMRPVELRLAGGTVVRLYHPIDADDPSHWARRADCFLPVLERCHDRWGVLPSGLKIEPANPPDVKD